MELAQFECETYISRSQRIQVIAMADEGEIAEVAWWYSTTILKNIGEGFRQRMKKSKLM